MRTLLIVAASLIALISNIAHADPVFDCLHTRT